MFRLGWGWGVREGGLGGCLGGGCTLVAIVDDGVGCSGGRRIVR